MQKQLTIYLALAALVVSPTKIRAAIIHGTVRDVLTEFNLLAGGGYTVYGGTGDKGTVSNIRFLNNRFSTRYYAKAGFYGPAAYVSTSGIGNAWTGNVWAETGAVLNQ